MSYARIRPRRGTKAEWNFVDPILMEGEFGVEYPDTGLGTGICKLKIGDGHMKWSELAYAFDGSAAMGIFGGTVDSFNSICLRSGTTAEWEAANPVLQLGEIVFDITKNSIKIGDGVHPFNSLLYISGSGMDFDFDFGDIDEELAEQI